MSIILSITSLSSLMHVTIDCACYVIKKWIIFFVYTSPPRLVPCVFRLTRRCGMRLTHKSEAMIIIITVRSQILILSHLNFEILVKTLSQLKMCLKYTVFYEQLFCIFYGFSILKAIINLLLIM